MGLIYKATFPNGKVYIGKTSLSLKERMSAHARNKNKNKIYNAISKYGFDSIVWEVVESGIDDEKKLSEREIYYIQFYDSLKSGYNSTKGGEGCLGMRHSEESRRKISQNHVGTLGKKYSQQTKEKMSNALHKRWLDNSYRETMSERFTGENNPMFGCFEEKSPVFREDIKWEDVCRVTIETGFKRNKTAERLSCNRSTIRNRIMQKGYKSWNEFCTSLRLERLK